MESSDKIAKKTRDQALHYISICCAFIVNFLNPDIIVFGGGISNSNHYKKINELTNKYITKSLRNQFKIAKHKISDSSGALGATALVFND